MSESIGIALLAAGKGTRLKMDIPKAILPILGRTMIDFVIDSVEEFASNSALSVSIGAVVGHKKEEVKAAVANRKNIQFAVQEQQLGTADALKSYFDSDEALWKKDYTLIMCADTPLITAEHLGKLYSELKSGNYDAVCATFEEKNEHKYGRIIRADKGFAIVEHKDATDEQKKINEVNSGLYLCKTSYIKEHLSNIGNKNASGEFYLTDLFQAGQNVAPVQFPKGNAFQGVNTIQHLDDVAFSLKLRKIRSLQESGVFIVDGTHNYIDWDVEIEPGAKIWPYTFIYKGSRVESGVEIETNVVIKNSEVKAGATILANSYLEDCVINSNASIGPFARIRPGADIGESCKVGNFVEIKKAKLHKGSKVSHLSYVGDAEIGAESNIGCGFITCNYDGANKHKTVIGSGTFVGSDVQMIAPVEVGNDAFIAAGSTITQSVPDGGFAVARGRQTTKEGMAKKFIKKKK